jgi:hypothetical protein
MLVLPGGDGGEGRVRGITYVRGVIDVVEKERALPGGAARRAAELGWARRARRGGSPPVGLDGVVDRLTG